MTFLSVTAHYGIYTYITLLVEILDFAGGIALALFIFGIGSVISVIVSAKIIDAYLRPLVVCMLAIGGISMAPPCPRLNSTVREDLNQDSRLA